MDELWKPLEFRGYSISNTGKVASAKNGWRVLRGGTDRKGYKYVILCDRGIPKTFAVHRLVAFAFIGDPPTPLHEINHKDGDKTNNTVGNLEWVTRSENHLHAYRVLGKKPPSGIKGKKTAPWRSA